MEPRIVCAANRNTETGQIILGARHWDMFMHQQADAYGREGKNRAGWIRADQGFVDQFGTFYNRQEAWKIAEKNGQIVRRVGGDTMNGGTLFSENLY